MWNLRDIARLYLEGRGYQEFDLFHPDRAPEAIRYLPGSSAISMFVGPNHSGKSRFLRALAQDASLRSAPHVAHPRWDMLRNQLASLSSRIDRLKNSLIWRHHEDQQELSSFLHDLQAISRHFELGHAPDSDLLRTFSQHQALGNLAASRLAGIRESGLIAEAQGVQQGMLGFEPKHEFEHATARIYIPVLRGLRLFHEPKRARGGPADHYLQRTKDDYFRDSDRVTVFTGYTLYHRIQEMLLGRKDERKLVHEYEKFLSEHFFESKEVTLTPHKGGVLHVTLDGEEQAIHDVGDGLQSAIILTFEPFVRRDEPCLFFIEEPELFLHPGLQRRIVEFFLDCKNHLFFFTTHSNHFLGMSFDYESISIYNFQRNVAASERDKPRFLVTPVSRGDRSSLELLGVRNSSVFLVNATIWVEGITDRRYVRKFMELYRRHCETGDVPPEEDISRLEEDIHYAFVEYGGANLKHWSFKSSGDEVLGQEQESEAPIEVQTLCAKAFLIRDDDETSSSDTKKRKKAQNDELEASLGERFARTPGREIENLLPPRVIDAVMKQSVPAAEIAPLTRAAYRDERLGQFLDQRAGAPGKWGGEYGTLKQKNEFCSKAIHQIDALAITFADLDDEVQEMVKRICRFLVEQNRLVIAPRRS